MDEKKKAKARRISELRKMVSAPHLVCDAEDLLPFAWRTPMVIDEHKCSKVLRELIAEENLRLKQPK